MKESIATERGIYYKIGNRWFWNCLPVDAQSYDPWGPNYYPPFDDLGNKRTINNAVDAGWSAIEDSLHQK